MFSFFLKTLCCLIPRSLWSNTNKFQLSKRDHKTAMVDELLTLGNRCTHKRGVPCLKPLCGFKKQETFLRKLRELTAKLSTCQQITPLKRYLTNIRIFVKGLKTNWTAWKVGFTTNFFWPSAIFTRVSTHISINFLINFLKF